MWQKSKNSFGSIFHILNATRFFFKFYVSAGYYNICLVIVVALAGGDVVFPHVFVWGSCF